MSSTAVSDLDARALKAADRIAHGLPPTFNGEMTYRYVNRGDEIVMVPLWKQRTYTLVSFKGMAA